MSIPSDTVDFFRTWRADRYIDECRVERQTRGAYNRGTKTHADTTANVHPAGTGCLIRPITVAGIEAGQTQTELASFEVQFAHDKAGIQPDDRIIVEASDWDADLVGQTLVVRSVVLDSYLTHISVTAELDQGDGSNA